MPKQPNLLFIFTDEQRYDTLEAYGNERIETPNLDKLAEQSSLFERAYVTQPVCTPSRSSLLTGLWPHATGCTENNVPLPSDAACLPEMLREGEYETAYFGKWHLGDEVFAQHGFDHWRSIEDMYAKYYSPGRSRAARSDYHRWLVAKGMNPANGEVFGRGEAARLPEDLSKPAYLAEETCSFLRGRGAPFVLFVNFLEPHMPFFGPRDGQYDPSQVTLPANFDNAPTEDQPFKLRLFRRRYFEGGHSGLPLKTEDDWRRMIANYWGLCSLVDTHVGRILRTLEDEGLAEDTIVVYTSDHGDMMGSHRLLAKCVMFEEAVRVPLLVRLPGQRRRKRLGWPISQIDIVPTLLELMGQDLPERLQGQSLRGILNGEAVEPRDVFIEWSGPNCGLAADVIGQARIPDSLGDAGSAEEVESAICDPVRTVITPAGWKLNCSPTRGEHELYDLRGDPWETTNLARCAEHAEQMNDLLNRIRRWQGQTGDAVELPERL